MLSKHLDIHYEALKAEDDDWVMYKDNITFNTDGPTKN